MIVAVCAGKGSPGVTTLATALAFAWPGERVLLEADVSGGDLAFRARRPDADEFLPPQPTVLDLAAAARLQLAPDALPTYALATSWGFPIIQGPPSHAAYAPLKGLWAGVAREASGWSGTVFADLGRLQPGHPGIAIARAADVVLVLGRADVGGLHHLREHVLAVSAAVGDPSHTRHPVCAVVRCADRAQRQAARQAAHVLSLAGSPVPVLGVFTDDPATAALLNEGRVTRRLVGSRLLGSTSQLVRSILTTCPQLTPDVADHHVATDTTGGDTVGGHRRAEIKRGGDVDLAEAAPAAGEASR